MVVGSNGGRSRKEAACQKGTNLSNQWGERGGGGTLELDLEFPDGGRIH